MAINTVQKLRHTRGRTFKVSGQLIKDGVPIDLSTIGIASQLRDGPALMADCDVQIVDAAKGQYALVVPVEAQVAWPLKALKMDVVYTFPSGDTLGTQVFYVEIDAGVTS